MEIIGIDWVRDFVDKEGRLVRPTKEGLVNLGRSYGLFYYLGQQNEEVIKLLVEYNTKRSQLELSLTSGVKCFEKYPHLIYIFLTKLCSDSDRVNKIEHVLEVRQPKVSNKDLANKLVDLNLSIFQKFNINAIIYAENHQYVLRK